MHTAAAASKTDRLDGWPFLALVPSVAGLALALWGLTASRAYITADPCIVGWDVPWGIPFAVLQSVGLMGAVVAYVVARSRSGDITRSNALAALIASVLIWVAALVLGVAPYDWHC